MSHLPSVVELRELVKDKIMTQDEAREILFSLEDQEDRDKKSLESEVKFLRELVENLSKRSDIVRAIGEYEVTPYAKRCGMDHMKVIVAEHILSVAIRHA